MSAPAVTSQAISELSSYNKSQIELIKNTVAVGATDDELKLFLTVCQSRKLDPFTRQIHFVKRSSRNKDGTFSEKGTIQTSIDGLRAIAERTGCYAGNDDPVYDSESKPTKATVTVWKIVGGVRCPFTATARWSEYVPTGKDYKTGQSKIISPMWIKMPLLMLGKCAEALALRKAFPESLSGLYSYEEMEQAETVKVEDVNQMATAKAPQAIAKTTVVDTKPKTAPIEDESSPALAIDITEIARLCKETKTDHAKIFAHYEVEHAIPTKGQAQAMLKVLRDRLAKQIDEVAKNNA